MTPSSMIRRGVVMLPSTRPVERMMTFSVEKISPRSTPPTTTVPACSVHSARPFFPTRTLPFVRITPVKSPSMRRRPLRSNSPLNFVPSPMIELMKASSVTWESLNRCSSG